MCGRYKRKSDKQRISEVFIVHAGLDDLPYEDGDDLRPQSLQPVILTNDAGERKWAFQLPDHLLFNARSEGVEHSKFWKESFLAGRCIGLATRSMSGLEVEKGKKKPKYEFVIPGQEPFPCPHCSSLKRRHSEVRRRHLYLPQGLRYLVHPRRLRYCRQTE